MYRRLSAISSGCIATASRSPSAIADTSRNAVAESWGIVANINRSSSGDGMSSGFIVVAPFHPGNRNELLLRACRILLCACIIHKDLCLVERASV
jgi:hypothetical protein